MTPILEEILRTGEVSAPDGKKIGLHSAIDATKGEKLQDLILAKRPHVSLEVGLAHGVSALFICDAMMRVGGRRHIAIDPVQRSGWQEIGLRNLDKAGFGPMVDFRERESQVALPQLLSEGAEIDFAFIDGWHTFDHVLVDFFYIDRMLRVGGVVVFDDASWSSVHPVCRFVATNRAYRACGFVGEAPPTRIGARVARWAARRNGFARRLFNTRLSIPDEDLGFSWNSRLIAFEKLADDSRAWDFHREF
jgi:predicted O-methyltransferase YrrM